MQEVCWIFIVNFTNVCQLVKHCELRIAIAKFYVMGCELFEHSWFLHLHKLLILVLEMSYCLFIATLFL